MEFTELSPKEFKKHRWTCPLEIGRYKIKDDITEVLIWPLIIYRIFTSCEEMWCIRISSLVQKERAWISEKIPVIIGSDNRLYTIDSNWVYNSITQV